MKNVMLVSRCTPEDFLKCFFIGDNEEIFSGMHDVALIEIAVI